jgi:hypothetical protein
VKNVSTFWDRGKLRRSDIFVDPNANKSLSPIGAASSGLFSDDVAPEQRLDSLWVGNTKKASAMTGFCACGNFVLRCGPYARQLVKIRVIRVSHFLAPLKPFKRF